MAYVGWILFVLMVGWFWMSMRYSHMQRVNVRNYVVYLLLNDNIREGHKAKFIEWIRKQNKPTPLEVTLDAQEIIDNMANTLADKSSIAVLGMITEELQKR